MVKLVVVYSNQTVVCWDEAGQMMPSLSGSWPQKRPSVIGSLDPSTEIRKIEALGRPYVLVKPSEL